MRSRGPRFFLLDADKPVYLPSFSREIKPHLGLTVSCFIHSEILRREVTDQPRREHCVQACAWRGGDVGGGGRTARGWWWWWLSLGWQERGGAGVILPGFS